MEHTPLPLDAPAIDPTVCPQRPQDQTTHQPREASRPHLLWLERLGDGAGEIAHDFNTLLASILGYTELAMAEVPQHSRLWRNLHRILSAGRRAQDLVRQLLTWSDTHPQERTPIPLHEVIEEAVTLLRVSLPPTITLWSHIAPEAGVIRADATQISQVVLNLCTNAVDAMREQGGSLEVTWEAVESSTSGAASAQERVRGPHARLTVRDTGPGIAPAILAQIFEPFFTTKAVGEGTGMGLAIVQRIVASHEGVIRVASTLGQGTTVEIDLPWLEREYTRATMVETPRSIKCACLLGVEAAALLTSSG
jgi:signal transduction histidine kinase